MRAPWRTPGMSGAAASLRDLKPGVGKPGRGCQQQAQKTGLEQGKYRVLLMNGSLAARKQRIPCSTGSAGPCAARSAYRKPASVLQLSARTRLAWKGAGGACVTARRSAGRAGRATKDAILLRPLARRRCRRSSYKLGAPTSLALQPAARRAPARARGRTSARRGAAASLGAAPGSGSPYEEIVERAVRCARAPARRGASPRGWTGAQNA